MCDNITSQLNLLAIKEKLYKIESPDLDSVSLLANKIKSENGDYVIVGLAIITNHVFTDSSLYTLIGKLICNEDLTSFDIETFINRNNKK